MKKLFDKFDKIVFCMSCICVFLPWFTWDAKMMGFCWGFDFILLLALPLFEIAFYLFSESNSKRLAVFTEACAVSLLVIMILAVGCWQSSFHIIQNWNFNLEPVLPTYWISLTIFVLLFIMLQIRIFRKAK